MVGAVALALVVATVLSTSADVTARVEILAVRTKDVVDTSVVPLVDAVLVKFAL